MKNITYKILQLILLFFVVSVFGQNSLDQYYYYKGEKVFLEMNTKTIAISFENENSMDAFTALKNRSTEISEIIEDQTRRIVIPIDDNANKRKAIKTFYMEVSTETNASLTDYYDQIELYKKSLNTLTISPTYKTKEGKEFGLSNNFYVKLKDQNDVGILYQKAKEMNVEILGHDRYMPLWFTLSITSAQKLNALHLANIFYETGLFQSTEPAFMYHDLQNANDPLFNDQWTLRNTGQSNGIVGIDINVEEAWSITTGNNIKVTVIDQGIQLDHPDLQANIGSVGFNANDPDFIGFDDPPPAKVFGGHGTACAGIIGAVRDNNIGISGVAPSCNLTPVSFFITTSATQLAFGINWAWNDGADILSNSWGSMTDSSIIDDAISNALTYGRNGLGCIVVFAIGNSNVNGGQYPANSNPLILSVGAIDRCGVRSGSINAVPQSCDPWSGGSNSGSSFGVPLDVVAGGTGIPTTYITGIEGVTDDGYITNFGGTSAACPYVAGVAALVLSVNPNLTVQEANDIIEQSAQKVRTDLYTYSNQSQRPNGIWNNEMGYGLVNAYQAVLLAQSYNCPEDLTINQNVNANESDIRKARNSITANNTIFSDGTAMYDAGAEIHLTPGFTAQEGSSFRAFIEGCSTERISNQKQNYQKENISYEKIEIDNKFLKEQPVLIAYPNPTKGILTIKSEVQISAWELRNSNGAFVKTSTLKNNSFRKDQLNLNDLRKGLYILKIILKDGTIIYKNIIKN